MRTSLFLASTLALAGVPFLQADFVIKDPVEFARCVPAGAQVVKLADGFRFTEGPVWVPADGGYLVFSDIPENRLIRWTAAGGAVTFRQPSGNANGNTLDRAGHLLTCEHSGRRVAIAVPGGETRTVVAEFEGRRLNSPNDAVVRSDGTIWFTDPDYGLPNNADRTGKVGKEQPGNFVYRFDPATGALAAVVRDFDKPNGLAFSPDERQLYVADAGTPKHIRVFAVDAAGAVTGGEVFATIDAGVPDGIRVDAAGRVWSSAGDGVHIFAPDGKLIGKILVPEAPANLCFGGPDGRTLFMTARRSLYAIEVLPRSE